MNVIAKTNSFHAVMKENTLVATSPGATSGSSTDQNIRGQDAPSTYAASSSSRGTAATKPRSVQMREGQRERDVHHDQAEQVVEQAEVLGLDEQRDHQRLERHHLHDEHHHQHRGAEPEPEPRDGHRGEQRQQAADHGPWTARRPASCAGTSRSRPRRARSGSCPSVKLVGSSEREPSLARGVDGRRQHHEDREQAEHQDRGEPEAQADAGPGRRLRLTARPA